MSEIARWYIAHTYSGYENKVKDNLAKIIENRKLHDMILDIRVPTEMVTEIKDGVKKEVERKVFPGYVLIKMIMTDESWYAVRNIRGVTGFVGPGSKPIPLTEEEIDRMGFDQKTVVIDFEEGDSVKINDGPLEDFVGTIEAIMPDKAKVRVVVSMFGRETPVELDYEQIEVLKF